VYLTSLGPVLQLLCGRRANVEREYVERKYGDSAERRESAEGHCHLLRGRVGRSVHGGVSPESRRVRAAA